MLTSIFAQLIDSLFIIKKKNKYEEVFTFINLSDFLQQPQRLRRALSITGKLLDATNKRAAYWCYR
jgi:hypothetical protein